MDTLLDILSPHGIESLESLIIAILIAFLIVKDGIIKLLTVEENKPLDKLVDAIPDIVNKIVDTLDNSLLKTSKRIKPKTNKEDFKTQ